MLWQNDNHELVVQCWKKNMVKNMAGKPLLDSTLCKYQEIVCIIIYNYALHTEDLSYEPYESYYYLLIYYYYYYYYLNIFLLSYYLMMCFVKILLICSHFLLNLCWLVTHRRGTKNPLAWSTLCSGYVQFRPNASTSQHACITGKNCLQISTLHTYFMHSL